MSTYWNLFVLIEGEPPLGGGLDREFYDLKLPFANTTGSPFPAIGGSFGASVLF